MSVRIPKLKGQVVTVRNELTQITGSGIHKKHPLEILRKNIQWTLEGNITGNDKVA